MNVGQIDFENQKEKLKAFLKSNPKFKDFNFEASGISVILNMLAYNAHYLGSYAYMLNNESSIDSAQTQQSIFSKSRGLGYTPKRVKSALVEVVVSQTVTEFPTNGYVVLHKGKKISGTSSRTSNTRYFSNMDDVYLYDWVKVPTGWKFSSAPTVLVEGSLQSWDFLVDRAIKYQAFVIKDHTLDIDSLRLYVKNSEADEGVQYYEAKSIFEVDQSSNVFYTSVTHDGYTEVYFGNDVFGKNPLDGQIVHCEYMSSSGEDGNGCTTFSFAGFDISANETSNSGSLGESLETTRFNAINNFKAQNRLFLPDDYRSVILGYFRNLQAINVWRGEDHFQKTYGKIFISIKPHYADRLSGSAKTEISTRLLDASKKLGADPVFIDPEFIECYVDIVLTTDINKTSVSIQSVQNKAVQAAIDYNENNLNIFDNILSDVELNDQIRKSSAYIRSSFTRKVLKKSIEVQRNSAGANTVNFGNSILPGSIGSACEAGIYVFSIYDKDGLIFAESTSAKNRVLKSIGTVNYETGTIQYQYPVKDWDGKESMEWTVTPENPDIKSQFNNIVRIARVRVVDE